MRNATVRVEVTSGFEWWRPLVQWFLCIPHLVYGGVLAVLSGFAAFAIGIAVLVTGRVPKRLGAFVALSLRERVRSYSYFFLLRTDTPPYPIAAVEQDPGDDPASTVSIRVPDTLPRWAILHVFVVLPQILVLAPIGLVMDLCYPVWMVLAAANRGWPESIESFLVRIERWVLAVVMYAALVSDEVPRFGFAAYEPGRTLTA